MLTASDMNQVPIIGTLKSLSNRTEMGWAWHKGEIVPSNWIDAFWCNEYAQIFTRKSL